MPAADGGGGLVETFGGHAVLATHQHKTGEQTTQHHPDGFIRNSTNLSQNQLFDDERGGTKIPRLFDPWLPAGQHGSAIVIVGYRPINDSTSQPLSEQILAAAAHDFMVAVFDGSLQLTFHDDREPATHSDKDQRALTANSLHRAVTWANSTRRAKRAERSHKTLTEGIQLPEPQIRATCGPGVRIWLRPRLNRDESKRNRVSVFRDGMWIEDNPDEFLQPRHFGEQKPFDAVVDLSSDHPFGSLVREAEGASHSKIARSELDKPKSKQLKVFMTALRDLLAANADPISREGEDTVLPELRLKLTGNAPLPKRKPKQAPGTETAGGAGEGNTDGDLSGASNNDKPVKTPGRAGPGNTTDGEHGGQKTGAPPAGNSSGISTSCRPDPDIPGRYHITWAATRPNSNRPTAKGLRLLVPSGTDQTNERQIPPRYLPITPASQGLVPHDAPEQTSTEIRINTGANTGKVTVDLADGEHVPPLDRGLVKAEMVHRAVQ